jgi:hypothetical protein
MHKTDGIRTRIPNNSTAADPRHWERRYKPMSWHIFEGDKIRRRLAQFGMTYRPLPHLALRSIVLCVL